MENISKYKEIKPKGSYEVWVSGLFDTGQYRVNLMEENDIHVTQTVDVDLRKPSQRRCLENYILELSRIIHLKTVLFGNGGCMNDPHYPLAKYKELFGHLRNMGFIHDLNIAIC